MGSSRTKRAAPALDPTAVEDQVQRVRQRLSAEGAVKLSKIQPKAMREILVARLAAEGFELNKSYARRPLLDQLREALAHGATVAKKSLGAVVRGASAPELGRALIEAERRGEVRRILRGKTEAFTAPETRVLAPGQLSALRAALSSLEKALAAAARKKGVSLLASDVEQVLEEAQRVLREPLSGDTGTQVVGVVKQPGLDTLLAALQATQDERTGLAFVPKVIARLLPDMTLAVAQGVLLTAARQELIELRPEGGLGRLTPEELRLCPPGPGGTRLSWARRLNGGPP